MRAQLKEKWGTNSLKGLVDKTNNAEMLASDEKCYLQPNYPQTILLNKKA